MTPVSPRTCTLPLLQTPSTPTYTYSNEANFGALEFLLSPEFTPKRLSYQDDANNEEDTDIIYILCCRCPHIANKIFSYISPRDLCMCVAVSKNWRSFIVGNKDFRSKITSYRKECKQDKENLAKNATQRLVSRPLSTRDENISHTTLTSKRESVQLQTGSFRSCPHCSSPARKLNTTRVHCGMCKYDFCPSCFRPYYNDTYALN